MSERKLGSYRLIEPLAVGGMAEIHRAVTQGVGGFEKLLALKLIHPNYSADPEFVRMLIDEAKLSVQLQHANIVQTFDLGCVEGQYYIAMELIDGIDLYRLLRRASEHEVAFPFEVAAYVVREVLNGLDYAHRKRDAKGHPLQIVHRDVSPQNVLVSFEGEVKIVDFGIAKATMRSQTTAAGVIKGKYYYMSPEQARGDAIDARSDLFSAGILLYETLVGEMLYMEEDLELLLDRVRKAQIAPPSTRRPGIPPDLEAIVLRALAKKTEDRYATAAEMASALTSFIHTLSRDFAPGRLSEFVRTVMGDDPTRAREPGPATASAAVPGETIGRDENSLIFRLADLKPPPRRTPAPRSTPSSAPRRADQVTSATSLPQPSPPVGDFAEGDEATIVDPGGMLLQQLGEERIAPQLDPSALPSIFPEDEREDTTQQPSLPRVRPPVLDQGADRAEASATLPTPLPRELPSQAQPPRMASPKMATPRPAISSSFAPVAEEQATVLRFDDWATPEGALAPTDAALSSPSTGEIAAALGTGPRGQLSRPVLFWGVLGAAVVGVFLIGLFFGLTRGGATRAMIEVVSSPPGAQVRMDGTPIARVTPVTIPDVDTQLLHHLVVALPGYDPWETDARFEGGARELRLQAVLTPTVGEVNIASTPSGAEAIVNGRVSGITPTTVHDLAPNEDLVIELRLRGYKAAHRTLAWEGKRQLSVTIPLEKAR